MSTSQQLSQARVTFRKVASKQGTAQGLLARFLVPGLFALAAALSPALSTASEWSEQTHTLAIGDFDGDGKSDLLYIAKDPGQASGIARSNGTAPNIDHQSWPSTFLGIPWHSGNYNPVVADFNGDGRSDLLLQGTASGSWSYLLYTNATGRFDGTSVHQAIPAYCQNLYWPATDHRIIAGNFRNNGVHVTAGKARRELILQATKRGGTNAVVDMTAVSTPYGERVEVPCGTGAAQTWGDGTAGFQWSLAQAVLHAGDFSGDGYDDVFVHAKPDFVMIDYEIPFPVPVYRPNSFGIVLGSATGLQSSSWQYWSRTQGSIDWSAANTNAIVGDHNGDGRADILLQAKAISGTSYWFSANTSGQFSVGTATGTLTNIGAGIGYQLLAANFDGLGNGVGLYQQARTPTGGSNGYSNDVAATLSSHDFSSVVPTEPFVNKVTPGTAVGAIPGEFSVDPSGGASYQIPIEVPPGVTGVQPQLAFAYSSRGANGLLGVGWTIPGLSSITRCPFTVAVDGVADGIDFDDKDAFCLDGQRLKTLSPHANGGVNAEYRTELESFQKVLSKSGQVNNPDWWEVSDKAGLIREYGAMGNGTSGTDSRIKARKPDQSVGPVIVWAVKRIRDRFGNFIEVSYGEDATNASFWPTEVTYGSDVTGARNVVGRVAFGYFSSDRPDSTAGRVAGGYVTGLKKLLQKVTVYARQNPEQGGPSAATAKVREYLLNYRQSSTSGLTQLTSIVLCDGGAGAAQSCFEDTLFQWQDGYRGFGETYSSLVTIAESDAGLRMADFNGDGRTDFAYAVPVAPMAPLTKAWASRSSSLRSSAVVTGQDATDWDYAVTMDYDNDSYDDIVQRTGSGGTLEVVRGSGTGLLAATTSTAISARALSYRSEVTALGDFNGDGRTDIAYAAANATASASVNSGGVAVQLNTASGLSTTSLYTPAIKDDRYPISFDHTVGTRKEEDSALRVINFDNDGRDDLLLLVDDCVSVEGPPDQFTNYCENQARVFSINEAGALHQKWPVSGVSGYWGGTWTKLRLVDANGDGLTDILHSAGGATGWQLLLGTGANDSWSVAPWNAASITVPYCVDEWTYFGNDPEPPFCSSNNYSLTEQKLDDALAYDYNRDGRTDVLFPEGNVWVVLPGGGAGFQNTIWGTDKAAIQPARAMVIDDRSDGIPDLMFPSGIVPEESFWHVYHGRGPISGVIEKVTDGFGASTSIQYVPLTAMDPASGAPVVYKGHQPMVVPANPTGGSPPQPAFPYVHFAAPLAVVHQFTADNGRTNTDGSSGAFRTTYEYYGLKAHRQGRGLLGFSEVRSWNDNTDIRTINRFTQEFPWTGMVAVAQQEYKGHTAYLSQLSGDSAPDLMLRYAAACETNSLCAQINPSIVTFQGGGIVSETVNVATERTFSDGRRFPYIRSSTAKTFALTPAGVGGIVKQAVTKYQSASGSDTQDAYDEYGNVLRIQVTTNDGTPGGDEHVITTTNVYDTANTTDWCLGRLNSTTVHHQNPSHAGNYQGNAAAGLATDITRTATFTYKAAPQCVLETESTEPSADSGAWRLTKTYAYDAYGNRSTEIAGGAGISPSQERTTTSTFTATFGQFPADVANAKGHHEYKKFDGRFAVPTEVEGPNGLKSLYVHDSFGRRTKETPLATLPGIYSEQQFYWCTAGVCTDGRAVFASRSSATDGAQSYTEFDRLGREVRTRKLNFEGQWLHVEKHFDPLGREYLVSDPYLTGQNRCWTFRRFDALSRVVKEWTSNTEEACTAAVLPYDKAESEFDSPVGAWKRADYSHDLVSTNGIGTKIVSNASDTSGYATARTGYKIINVVGRTRYVLDEQTAGGCNPAATLSGSTASCAQTEYDYDAQGNTTYVKQVNTAQGVTAATQLTFNRRGFKTQTVDPDMGTWNYNYNTFGELIWQQDAKAQVVTFGYDTLGRTVTRTEGTDVTTWEFDTGLKGVGKLAKVTAPDGFEESYFYDGSGRLETTKRLMEGQYFWVDQTYDAQGRLDVVKYPNSVSTSSSSSAGPDADRLRVRHNYNANGYLASVSDVASTEVFWQANEVDVLGNVKKETLGNDLVTQRTFDRVTGYLNVLRTGSVANETSIQYMEFGFDQAANLRIRKDRSTFVNSGSGAREEFDYDKLYRVAQARLFATHGGSTPSATENYAYDVFGNLTSKAAYTAYQYGARPNCSNQVIRPHAVYEVTVSATTRRYCYDANGNLASAVNAAYDTVTWWPANLARKVSKGSQYSEFWYGPDRARYKQVAFQDASNQTTTLYVGTLYEKLTKVVAGNTTTEHAHYVRAGSQVIAIWKRVGTQAPTASYLHRDHLGSVVAITDGTGSPSTAERFSFDPWGKRRDRNSWQSVAPGSYPAPAPLATPRGYTGHEHVDALGIVHMNGRIYDPEIGKFLSADPFVQFPESTQGFNRYSYVDNNPLTYTDPSGFFKGRDALRIAIIAVASYVTFGATVGAFSSASYSSTGAMIAAATPGALATGAFASGFVGGFMASGGDFKTALLSGVGAAITSGIGSVFGQPTLFQDPARALAKALVHGFTQGTLQATMGGRFGDGFLGGFAGSLLDRAAEGVAGSAGSDWVATAVAAVIGGTVAVIGGGAFANGAASAAFVDMFNRASHRSSIVFEDPATETADLRKKAQLAVSVALAEHGANIPPMRSLLLRIAPGGIGDYGIGFYEAHTRLGRIRIGLPDLQILEQSAVSSLIWHEIDHVIQTYHHGPGWTQADIDGWHKSTYSRQWALRNDSRFYLRPRTDFYNTILENCRLAGGGCNP